MKIDPARTALLVMDYQAGILSQVNDPEMLISKAAQAIRTVRERGGRIGYVRVGFTDDEYAAIPDSNKGFSSAKAAGRRFDANSGETAISDAIAPMDGDIVVRKTRVGAFSTTDLHQQLQRHGIDTLILAGISSSGVVLSTMRDAADRDYRLFVLSDACADPVPDVHAMLFENVFPRQADVIATDQLEALFCP